ncbi:methyl-accepting chemotaxis protein [Paucibacter oligotrophus]|uniref:Methyl-accepting chemotaxis protein n=1 Tax=Roseateles oligotrophus TaxID=1769250 RepID=A0A840LHG6_9BURK|nr:methyl-accepting chemotaxis protein [Roseateles oligotrophus]MBB4845658.1 methyl-accepting chemotaxis protein [Roseateles oligotrophus]
MKLSNYKIGAKLGFAFLTIVAINLLVGMFSLSQLGRINDKVEDIGGNWLPSIKVLGEIQDATSDFRLLQANHVMSLNGKDMDAIDEELDAARLRIEAALKTYAPMVTPGAERAAYEALLPSVAALFETHSRLAPLSRGGEATAAKAQAFYREDSFKAFARMNEGIVKLIEINDKGSAAAVLSSQETYGRAKLMESVSLLISVSIAAALAVWVTRLITQPMGTAVQAAQRFAEGDLTMDLRNEGRDETAQLLNALDGMRGRLSEIVGNVRRNADSVATASAEIAQGNQDLSGRTEQQASALEQTAASMEQLGSTVSQNAENARQGNQLAQGASTVAIQGGEVVGQVVETMKGINDSSKRIVDIISVIDGIAFQTNILALNAAVEAARAGEQGRGFAVVASEVRSLAQRSADAAKEIKSLISTSVERVEVGTALVDKAGATMQEVVSAIRRVTDIMGEISSASVEQSSGVAQVGEAVTQMDQSTQQNAALVEQSAAAAESLRNQAQQLVENVAVFKLR